MEEEGETLKLQEDVCMSRGPRSKSHRGLAYPEFAGVAFCRNLDFTNL